MSQAVPWLPKPPRASQGKAESKPGTWLDVPYSFLFPYLFLGVACGGPSENPGNLVPVCVAQGDPLPRPPSAPAPTVSFTERPRLGW